MNPTPKYLFRPEPLEPIRLSTAMSPVPRLLPALVAMVLIAGTFALLLAMASAGIGLVEW